MTNLSCKTVRKWLIRATFSTLAGKAVETLTIG
jgi:hypothetical protein